MLFKRSAAIDPIPTYRGADSSGEALKERTKPEWILLGGGQKEAHRVSAAKRSEPAEGLAERAALRRDLQHMAYSAIPIALVLVVACAINVHFVIAGWPLFVILGLGLYAGALATLDAFPDASDK